MANYTIIGGDKKEYGPVTPEEMRQWITEGRLDGNTLARTENDTEWRPLSTFPEFSLLLQPRQTPPPLGSLRQPTPAAYVQEVRSPAICLIVVGGLSILMALWGLVSELIQPENFEQMLTSLPQYNDPQFQQSLASLSPQAQHLIHFLIHFVSLIWVRIGEHLFTLAMSIIVLMGGVRMLALRSYEFVFIAAILAMIPCVTPCCLIGLPFGIWAVIVLRKPGIKDQFN